MVAGAAELELLIEFVTDLQMNLCEARHDLGFRFVPKSGQKCRDFLIGTGADSETTVAFTDNGIVIHADEFTDDFVASLRQNLRARIRITDDAQARGCDIKIAECQIRTETLQTEHKLIDIACPDAAPAFALRREFIRRNRVMNHYQRPCLRPTFDMNEIVQSGLEQMHPVDEREIHETVAEHRFPRSGREEGFAGFRENIRVLRERMPDFRPGIDADRSGLRCRQGERLAILHAYFEITRGADQTMQLTQQKVIFRNRPHDLRRILRDSFAPF